MHRSMLAGDGIVGQINSPGAKKRVVILGGGFPGADTALRLGKQFAGSPDIEIVPLSKKDFVLFAPMLYEVGLRCAQVLAQKGKDFVALEPMTAAASALTSGHGLRFVKTVTFLRRRWWP
jgi:hypothetical protein